MASASPSSDPRLPTGIPGLDAVLGGGLPADRLYLLQGDPGVGKTTFALQFALFGAARGEPAMYVSFSETRGEIESVARSHRWDLSRLEIYEFLEEKGRDPKAAEQTMYHPAEVELEETTRPLLDAIDRVRPKRVVIDSVSHIRLLARDPMRYRQHLLTLKHFFTERGCTVVLINDKMTSSDDVLQTIVHGIVVLEKRTPVYGTTRRRLSIEKLRGVRYAEGYHDYRIATGGLEVFHRLVAASHPAVERENELVTSGVAEIDELVGGGLEPGTSTLLTGGAGTGKSSLAAQYAVASARRGEKAAIFCFEESLETWTDRARGLGLDPDPLVTAKHLVLRAIDPAELTPGELASSVLELVAEGCRMVVIDSLNGYLQSVPEESFLLLHMHELLSYLGHAGVTTLLVLAQQGLIGPSLHVPVDVSYLADAVMLLRFFESRGQVRKAISVVKKRRGPHESTLREFTLSSAGIRLGPPLTQFQGVLTGIPSILDPVKDP